MTKEQLRDDILCAMKDFINPTAWGILKDVLVEKFQSITIEEPQMLATTENNNEYFIKMFNTFKGSRLSAKSMKFYNYTLKKFCEMIPKSLAEVTANDIDFFLMNLDCSEVTLNNYRRNLSAFFSWMVKKRIIIFNPCNEVEPYKEIKKPIDHLSPEEYEQIREGCKNTRERAMVEYMRCTAERVGEIINTKVSDVDFNTGVVLAYGEKTRQYRYVCLDGVALGYLRKYIAERGINIDSEEPLFVSRMTQKALTADGIRAVLNGIKIRANMKRRIYPHLFRKTCATTIVRRGGTVEDASDYLGHAPQSVTEKNYTAKDEKRIFKIFDQYVAIV